MRNTLLSLLLVPAFAACGASQSAAGGGNGAGLITSGGSGTNGTHLTTAASTSGSPTATTTAAAAATTSGGATSSNPAAAATVAAATTGTTGIMLTTAAATSGSTGTTATSGGSCPGYADPNTTASCTCSSGETCGANNCYGGWYCELSTSTCVAPPTNCSAGTTSTTGTTTGTTGTTATSGGSCPGYADPNTAAGCTCSSGETCGANNCYGGWYCELSDNKCVAPPSNCSAGTGTTTTTTAAATTSSGSTGTTGITTIGSSSGSTGTTGTSPLGVGGGTVSQLSFAIVGDTRPCNADTAYPTPIITQIYQDIATSGAQFVVATGDYMYTNDVTSTTDGASQIANYVTARQAFSGPVFPAMGNHECNTDTTGECDDSGNIVSGTSSGSQSGNFLAFQSALLAPINQTKAYYSIPISDAAGQWTALFIFVAANAWTTDQQTWLNTTLQQAQAANTTYVFIVRHESEQEGSGTSTPGTTGSESVITGGNYHVTLRLVGHTHEWNFLTGTPEVISGNGGACESSGSGPYGDPESGQTYGYMLVTRQSDGTLSVQEMDYSTNMAVSSQTYSP